ncbi:MAG TPA: hypothetical protein VNS58_07555 [Puia sp.]|nr:hypothetical protein [Puia sp.]
MPRLTAAPIPRAYLVNKRKKQAAHSHPGTTYIATRKPVATKINYKALPPSPTQNRFTLLVNILSTVRRAFFQKMTTAD